MDRYPSTAASTSRESVLATNKVLRNTYLLLGATLLFSAAMAGVSMALNLPYFGLLTLLRLLRAAVRGPARRRTAAGASCGRSR